MVDAYGERVSCYDLRGRETLTQRVVGADTYVLARAFDRLGNVVQLTYPDGEAVAFGYSAGQAVSMSSLTYNQTLVGSVARTPWLAPEAVALGNGQTTAYGYDHRLRLMSMVTGTVQDVELAYDLAGNVQSVTDATGTPETVTYVYDDLNWLTDASGFAGALVAHYGYDAIGNLHTKQEGADALTLAYPPSGPGADRPHAVDSVSGTQANDLTYDENGNLAGAHGHAYGFDAENRLSGNLASPPAADPAAGLLCVDFDGDKTITVLDMTLLSGQFGKTRASAGFDYRADLDWDGAVTSLDLSIEASQFLQPCVSDQTVYTYDGGGTLLKRTNADGTSVVYVGGIYEETRSPGGSVTSVTKYYAAAGATAMRTQTAAGGPPETGADCGDLQDDDGDAIADDGCPLYLLKDHLGGTTKVLDSAGSVVSELRYWPYGATRSGGITQTDKLYTGQQQEAGDDALGLYNYKARFYSTTVGRFASADPFTGGGLNRHAYVVNNPLRFTDPSGLCFQSVDGSTLPCDKGDWLTWLECAFSCPNEGSLGPLRDFALLGVRQKLFWGNALRLAAEWGYSFVGEIVLTIARNATPLNYDMVIP